LIVAADTEPLSMLSADRSSVVVNTHEELPPQFIQDRDFQFPAERLLHELRSRCRADRLSTLDATRLASALLGDSIAANVFMLGFAFQRGLLPLSGKSLYRALELYGVNVNRNKQTFDWGRYTAESRDEVEQMAGMIERPAQETQPLSAIVSRRVEFLEAYQDRRYADKYRFRVEQVAAVEDRLSPGSKRLAEAVARNYFKLLSYKDEYEVARLSAQTDCLASLRQNVGSNVKHTFHLSPPLIAGVDRESGRPRKYEFGGWIVVLLRVLAPLKRLRGTRWDLFGWTTERRMERRLIAEYEELLDRITAEVDEQRLDLAVLLASLPDSIRGFGPIKMQAVENYRRVLGEKVAEWVSAGNATRSDRHASAA
jgi:indolepyruvate ferredoxin oxidoreductase